MKTAVTVLQEIMVKQKQFPNYECIGQSGPQHLAAFTYQCLAFGISVTATARSKKEAKQEAARIMLLQLDERGYSIPPPFCRGGAPVHTVGPSTSSSCPSVTAAAAGAAPDVGPLPVRSYVALLNELCDEYRLPAVNYELTADTGPAHARHFTVSARLGMHERNATSTTKKLARQLAAEQLYTYLKENLSRVTKDFVEDEALARAHEKAMERYVETRDENSRRPNLGQKVADYHLGLLTNIDETKQNLVVEKLEECQGLPTEEALQTVVDVLGLTVERHALPTASSKELIVLKLVPTTPELAMTGYSYEEAAADALQYIRLAFRFT